MNELQFGDNFCFICVTIMALHIWTQEKHRWFTDIYMITIAIFFISCIVNSAKITNAESCSSYPCLIFDEPFDNLDFKTWKHMKTASFTGNQEFQYYTNNRSNSFVKDGVLHLKPTLTNNSFYDGFLANGILDLWGSGADTCTGNRDNDGCFRKGSQELIIPPIQSAAITTQDSFAFKYGKIEVRAKMPIGDWLWPAVWLMPIHSEYGSWPASGEIDLVESRGNANLKRETGDTFVGVQRVQQSLHWGPNMYYNGHGYTLAKTNKEKGTFADKFHTFSAVWNPNSIIFYVNHKVTLNVTMQHSGFFEYGNFAGRVNNLANPWEGATKMAPFDKEFYIILNLAVGGTNDYFHSSYVPNSPWKNEDGKKAVTSFWNARDQWLSTWNGDESALKIDHVKVWKLEKDV